MSIVCTIFRVIIKTQWFSSVKSSESKLLSILPSLTAIFLSSVKLRVSPSSLSSIKLSIDPISSVAPLTRLF